MMAFPPPPSNFQYVYHVSVDDHLQPYHPRGVTQLVPVSAKRGRFIPDEELWDLCFFAKYFGARDHPDECSGLPATS
jgi:hypothetical protein